ncbi:hypothetical protein FH972_021204 [Carpinus fangiana]|uniref:Uncharacterized protein n=1 Tax=Carpinus fangiana TaxID=176857 RepID=A0A5N6KQU1_9ROSI|nr:hypothetical protein FH972_021204 [Carpinus fangiana]
MFNYFRNHGHQIPHRRAGSDPATPQSPQWASSSRSQWPEVIPLPGHPPHSGYATPHTESPISPIPPQLPPIPRVASRSAHNAPDPNSSAPHAPSRPFNDDEATAYRRVVAHERAESVPSIRRTSAADDDYNPASYYRANANTQNLGTSQSSWRPSPNPSQLRPFEPLNRQDQRLHGYTSSTNASEAPQGPHHRPLTATSTLSATDETTTQASSYNYTSMSSSYSTLPKNPSFSNSAQELQRPPSGLAQTQKESGPKMAKAKLNLLNPMNLLMRRRTSQGGESLQEGSFSNSRASAVPAMSLPDDYDPRIKGAGVHDFNAPRTRRQPSTSDSGGFSHRKPRGHISTVPYADIDSSPERPHHPVFVEHFDDQDQPHDASTIRRESLANTDFVKRMSRQLDLDLPDHDTGAHTPPKAFQPPAPHTPRTVERASKETVSTAYRVSMDRSTIHSSASRDTSDTSPPGSPSRSRSLRASPGPDLSFRTSLPKHMTSNASHTSRFSFQQNESSMEQEKALEDKHKRKAVPAPETQPSQDSRFDELDEEDPSAYDDIDFDDGEDDIPYIGDDANDYAINNRISLPLNQPKNMAWSQQRQPSPPPVWDQARAQASSFVDSQPGEQQQLERNDTNISQVTDDLYFDDGMIEDDMMEPPTNASNEFDESVLDSMPHDSGYDVPRNRKLPADSLRQTPDLQSLSRLESTHLDHSTSSSTLPDINLDEVPVRIPSDSDTTSRKPSLSAATRLNAYHSALASAATKAAEGGKFARQASIGASSSVYDTNSAQEGPSPAGDDTGDDTHSRSMYEQLEEQHVGFDDYDTDLEDDPMIAAANAEVLATEDAEFYGQEFGFYGSSSGTGEMFNGGFFGTNNTTTGNATREPNLTPITERSEFSTRNSFISIQGHGSSSALSGLPGGVPWNNEAASSPGLKDLMGSSEDDMTLSQLMKLRREAFGGAGTRSSFGTMSADSSPTYSSSSPMYTKPMVHHSPQSSSGAIDLDVTPRRPDTAKTQASSGGESAGDDEIEQYGYSSPSSPTLRHAVFGHRATPSMSDLEESTKGSSLRGMQSSAPSFKTAASAAALNVTQARSPSTVNRRPVPAAINPQLDVPILASPSPNKKRMSATSTLSSSTLGPSPVSPMTSPGITGPIKPSTLSPVSPLPASPPQPSMAPLPPAAVMSKFAQRPAPDAYRRASYQTQSDSGHPNQTVGLQAPHRTSRNGGPSDGHDSVAYVLEGPDSSHTGVSGQAGESGQWYLERRRTMSTGEVVVVGRELVEGGRI